jgi:hypothetical protein
MIEEKDEALLNEDNAATAVQTETEEPSHIDESVEVEPVVDENTTLTDAPDTAIVDETSPLIDTNTEAIVSIQEEHTSTLETEISPSIEMESVIEPVIDATPVEESATTEHSTEDDSEEETEDYSHFSKQDFLNLVKRLDKETDFRKVTPILKEIKPLFDELANTEKEQAYNAYIAEGGEKDGFKYKEDKLAKEFYRLFDQIYKNRAKQIAQLEAEKEKNLLAKQAILDKIRALIEKEEEKKGDIDELKKLQSEWKSIGAVPNKQTQELWQSYNALVDLFYDKRSIYLELKELDRRKNLELKREICEKAEKLAEQPTVTKAIKELNELHEEFKHIGPVPKEEQEALWLRFKTASDVLYQHKREFVKDKEEERKENLVQKMALCESVKPFEDFTTDKISEWNAKTQELVEIQKKWEAIRNIPRESIKETSRLFWTAFKKFFHHKNTFLRSLDEERETNLAQKVAICEEAEALTASDQDRRKVADTLKQLQVRWREIGPVPIKYRDNIFERFKKCCDSFFSERREQFNSQEKEYETNLKAKKELCQRINDTVNAEETLVAQFIAEWKNIGFVPKKDKAFIQEKFDKAIAAFIARIPASEDDKEKLQTSVDLAFINDSPHSERKVVQKESALKRKISKLETDIVTLKNNMGFFANSKTANQFKESIEKQIAEAEQQLASLKKQLKTLQNY